MTNNVALRPDANRPKLESKLSQRLEDGEIYDSLTSCYDITQPKNKTEKPRVLLIVPPYTRIERPLELVLDNLARESNTRSGFYTGEEFEDDRNLIKLLQGEGITHLKEWKRAGIPMGLLRVWTAAKKAGYEVAIIDSVFEGWNNEAFLFTSTHGIQIYSYGLSRKDLERRIREFNPHIAAVSNDYTHQRGNALAAADLVKAINEKIPVIIGGTDASALPADYLISSPVDFVVKRQ